MRGRNVRKATARFSLALTIVVVVAVTLVLVLLAGQNTTSINARLLSVSDLPAGWTAVSSPTTSPDFTKSGCLSGLSATSNSSHTSASVSFTERSGLPAIGEYLAHGTSLGAEYSRAVKELDNCHSLTFTQNKYKIRATITRVALATVGNQSSTYALTYSVKGFALVSTVVFFRTSDYLGEFVYSDSVAPPASTITSLAREVANKAEGKTVHPSIVSIVSVPVRVADTSAGQVGYRSFGNGPPLILIMGYGGTMQVWDPRFIDALGEHHRVIIFDNAGIGATASLPSPLSIDAMATQTSALITTLGLEKPDVLGWSMGGMIAQALAIQHPAQVGRLILCATFPGTGSLKPSQTAIDDLKSTNPATSMSVLFPPDQSPAKQGFTIAIGNYPPSSPTPAAVITSQTYAVDQWFAGRDLAGKMFAQITAPTLVADGAIDRLDPTVNDRRLAASIGHAKLMIYQDAGHAFLFQESSFVSAIEAFLGAK
jgi:pimeloyl-ACP methyl ester carboxylesterase